MLRSYDARDFPAQAVAASKRGRRVSVCLPARNEEATVGAVVEVVRRELMERHSVVDELIVVDDGSTDRTAAVAAGAGATVVDARSILPGRGGPHGKGEAMWRAVHVASGDVVVFCDADVRTFHAGYVLGTAGALLAHDDLTFVKGFYDRPVGGRAGEGGRVTELLARPAIATMHPRLGAFVQPLAGEFAARRTVLTSVPFVGGYGVDLGLLIDVSTRYGVGTMAQCDLGERIHRNRPLGELGAQAAAVLQVALQRAGWPPAPGRPGLPWTTQLQQPDGVVDVTMSELPPLADLPPYRLTA